MYSLQGQDTEQNDISQPNFVKKRKKGHKCMSHFSCQMPSVRWRPTSELQRTTKQKLLPPCLFSKHRKLTISALQEGALFRYLQSVFTVLTHSFKELHTTVKKKKNQQMDSVERCKDLKQ